MSIQLRCVSWIVFAHLIFPAGGLAQFQDPAPPTTQAISDAKPAAVEQPGLVFHAPPGALEGAVVGDWPSLLGPTFNNISRETNLLAELPDKGPNIVWEVPRGNGYSSVAVVGGRLIHFHRVGDEEVVECLEAETGKRFWRLSYPVTYEDRYGFSNGPRCTPMIDGDRVYTYGVAGTLQCLDLASGEVVWRRAIVEEFEQKRNFFGVGASPLVEGNVLVVNVGAHDVGASVVGFDKHTGRILWTAGDKWGQSYASPVPATFHGKRRVLVFAGGESSPPTGGLMCIDPITGKIDFEVPWRGRPRESANASSPLVIEGNRVFISECYGRGSAMAEILPDMTPKLLWTNEVFGTHFMTAIYKNGHIYGIHGHGPLDCELVCLDATDGTEKWRVRPRWPEKITRNGLTQDENFELNLAQLIEADGRTLVLTENGHLLWMDLTPQAPKPLSRAFLFHASEGWTGPVLSRGLLYVCQNRKDFEGHTEPRLICYDLRGR